MKIKCLLLTVLLGALCGSLHPCPDSSYGKCGRCQSVNDPHITTFDAVFYDQHRDGCFEYVTECKDATNTVPFEICGCHYQCIPNGSAGPRCIGNVTLSFFDSAVVPTKTWDILINYENPANPARNTLTNPATSLISGNTYYFDPIPVGNKFEYIQIGNEHIFKIYGGISAFYGYVSYDAAIGYLEVFLDESYFQRNACGLCGLFNQNPNDDFTGSDGIVYVQQSDVPNWPNVYGVTPAVVNQINDFANTYLCDDDGGNENECYESAKICCVKLWYEIFNEMEWTNKIITAQDIYDKWLNGCIIDACSLTNNGITQCHLSHEIYQFAKQIAVATAAKIYQ